MVRGERGEIRLELCALQLVRERLRHETRETPTADSLPDCGSELEGYAHRELGDL
jgi:hypothetical protein